MNPLLPPPEREAKAHAEMARRKDDMLNSALKAARRGKLPKERMTWRRWVDWGLRVVLLLIALAILSLFTGWAERFL